MSVFKATKLMYHQEIGIKSKIHTQALWLNNLPSFHGKQVEYDLYTPSKKHNINPSTIIVVNGMSTMGNKDPRIVKLSESLAHCGYNVVTPYFESISNLEIDPHQAIQIKEVIQAIFENKDISHHKELGLMAVSFSAGMCLRAASLLDNKKILKSLCLIGGYADLKTTLNHLLLDPKADEYGRLIVLKNFIQWVYPFPDLSHAFYLAALLNSFEDDAHQQRLHSHLSNMKTKEKKLYNEILESVELRKRILDSLWKNPNLNHYAVDMDVIQVIPHVECNVTLIHGKGDDVISPEQSDRLHIALLKAHKISHKCITKLLDHGDTNYSLSLLSEVGRFLRALSFFFKSMQ